MKALTQHEVGERDYVTWDILAAYPSSGVLAEHDAKALEAAADKYRSGQVTGIFTGRDDYVKAWLRERAQVIREGKSDV